MNAENIDENTADRLTYCIAKTKFLGLLSTATSDNSNVCDINYIFFMLDGCIMLFFYSCKYSQALTISKALFPVFYSKVGSVEPM